MSIDGGLLDQVTQEFLNALRKDASIIQEAAKSLFYYLAVIQLTLSTMWMTLAGESLERMTSKLIQLCFTFGFLYGLIQYGGTWIPALMNGFIEIGQKAGVQSLDPSSILSQGLSIVGGIIKGFFNWGLLAHPFVSIMGATVSVVIIFIYAFIAAELTIMLVKAYIIVALSSLFFAFGATDYTQAMTKNYFNAAIGLGLKLMTLYLLLGVGQNIGASWAEMTAKAANEHLLMPMFLIMAAAIVYYLIIKNIPAFIAGLSGVGGFRNYGDTAMAMAANTGVSTGNALINSQRLMGKGVQGGVSLGQGLAQLGQTFSHGFNSKHSFSEGVSTGLGNMAKTMGSASANTVKDAAMKNQPHLKTSDKFKGHLSNKVNSIHQKHQEDKNSPWRKL